MAMNKVEICGVDTSTLPVLTNERMRELFPLVHGGDLNAREEFIPTIDSEMCKLDDRLSGTQYLKGCLVTRNKMIHTWGPSKVKGYRQKGYRPESGLRYERL